MQIIKTGKVSCVLGHQKKVWAFTWKGLHRKMNKYVDGSHLHPEVK